MDIILRLIGYVGVLLSVILMGVMLLAARREMRLRWWGLLLSVLFELAFLVVFLLVSGAALNLVLMIPLMAVGLLVGLLSGLTAPLFIREGQVFGNRPWPVLLLWGTSLVLAQFLNLFGSALAASIGLMFLVLTTGGQVGTDGILFLRRIFIRAPVSSH